MFNESTYREAQSGIPGFGRADAMDAKLSETDRRTVDLLLAGDSADQDAGLNPAMLERVNSVRRLLGLLQAMPAEEPSSGLVNATMQKIAALNAASGGQAPQASV